MLALTIALSYYTGTIVLIITSIGFILALILKNIRFDKDIIKSFLKSITNKKVISYMVIVLILSTFLFVISDQRIASYTYSNIEASTAKAGVLFLPVPYLEDLDVSTAKPIRPYKSKIRFLGLPIISWQDIYLMCLGLTFIFHFLFKKTSKDDKDIAYSLIPVVMVALAFLIINMPERAFSYLAFFALLSIKIPIKFFKAFVIISVIFMTITSFLVANQRVEFFSNTEGEIAAAEWVSKNLDGGILSDERFISLLISNGYYNVNGFRDNSEYVLPTFYEADIEKTKEVFTALNVTYFATTNRMRNSYILMLNFPQEPMENEQMYEDAFLKIYDNSDVRIYKVLSNESIW